jgi:hypothetical protein
MSFCKTLELQVRDQRFALSMKKGNMTTNRPSPFPMLEPFASVVHFQPPESLLPAACERAFSALDMLDVSQRERARRALAVIQSIQHPRLSLTPMERLEWLVTKARTLPPPCLRALLDVREYGTCPSSDPGFETLVALKLWVLPGLQSLQGTSVASSEGTL